MFDIFFNPRILDKAQTVEGNATLESYYESQNFSTPPKDLEPILEPILFPEIKTVPLNVSQSIKEEKLVPEIEKEETLNTKDNKVFIQRKKKPIVSFSVLVVTYSQKVFQFCF